VREIIETYKNVVLWQEVKSEAELTAQQEGEEEEQVDEKDPDAEDYSNIKVNRCLHFLEPGA